MEHQLLAAGIEVLDDPTGSVDRRTSEHGRLRPRAARAPNRDRRPQADVLI